MRAHRRIKNDLRKVFKSGDPAAKPLTILDPNLCILKKEDHGWPDLGDIALTYEKGIFERIIEKELEVIFGICKIARSQNGDSGFKMRRSKFGERFIVVKLYGVGDTRLLYTIPKNMAASSVLGKPRILSHDQIERKINPS